MKRFMWALALVLLIALPATVQGVVDGKINYTQEWDPSIHRGILLITEDDWVHPAWLTLADSLECPISFMCAGGDLADDPVRQPDVRLAWQYGADIGVHTQPVTPTVPNMTDAQIRVMFNSNINTVRDVIGTTVGGPLNSTWSPQSWVYYSNDWNERALRIGHDYFAWQRVRYTSADSASTGAVTTAYHPLMSSSSSEYIGLSNNKVANTPYNSLRGRGVPIIQAKADRMPFQFTCGGCDDATSDTTGNGAYLDDLIKYHLIGVPNIHPSGDVNYTELQDFMVKAMARPEIWKATPRKLMSVPALAAAFNRSLTDTLYISATASEMGLGTWADPAHLKIALNENWTHPVKCKTDETYYLGSLVPPTTDIIPAGAITVIGPSTFKVYEQGNVAGDFSDAISSVFKASPRADSLDAHPVMVSGHTTKAYKWGVGQKYIDMTFESHGSTLYSAVPSYAVSVNGKHVTFDRCYFKSNTKTAIRSHSDASHLRVLNSIISIDTTAATTCNAVMIQHVSDSMQVFIGNIFKTAPNAQQHNLLYRELAPAAGAGKQDTLVNNLFWNVGTNTSSRALRFDAATQSPSPRFNCYFGGNMMRSASTSPLIVYLLSTAQTVPWAYCDTALADLRLGDTTTRTKHWSVTFDPLAYSADTLKWGGLPMPTSYGTSKYWGSIGPTQYTATPFVSLSQPANTTAYAHYETPWKLLQLVNVGVLPPSDSLRADSAYDIYLGTTQQEQEQYRIYIDASSYWPEATRRKMRWRVK